MNLFLITSYFLTRSLETDLESFGTRGRFLEGHFHRQGKWDYLWSLLSGLDGGQKKELNSLSDSGHLTGAKSVYERKVESMLLSPFHFSYLVQRGIIEFIHS